MTAEGHIVAGRYRVVRSLAAGGISQVWLATDDLLRRHVALKQCALPDGLDPDEQELLRSWTLREARAFARVQHGNVIRILDVVPGTELPWIVMEYVPSRSLLQVVEESGPLPPERVAAIGLAVLDGLNAIGRAGVLHLDVKPGNVLIGDDGRVVLGDFGPVVTEQGVGALSGAGIVLGSPNYVAPERLSEGVSTARADLWSLGATLYYAVEGRPPFLRASPAATLRAIDGGPPDPPRRAGPLADVLVGLLRRDPAARPSAAEAGERLRDVAERRRAAAQPGEGRRPRSVLRRRAGVFAAAAAAVVALAAAAAGTQDRQAEARWAEAAPMSRPAVPSGPSPVLPRGFTWWPVTGGFRVAAPSGWRPSARAPGTLRLTAPAGGLTLQVSTWTPAHHNVVAALVAEERDAGLTGYRRVRIDSLAEPAGAVWEYTYRDPAAGPMRGLERVTAGDGHTYRIQWRAPRSQWPEGLHTMDLVLDSFGPQPGA